MTFVIIIIQTSGLWTSLLARCFFKEPLIWIELVGMLICFISVVTISMNGAKNYTEDSVSKDQSLTNVVSENMQILGFILISINSWVYAVNCVLNRALRDVNSAVVLFWHGLGGALIAILVILLEYWFFFDNSE